MNTQTQLEKINILNLDEAIIVNAKNFLKAIKFVAVAVSKQASRPILMDVHVEIGENQLTLEATDSHILTQLKVPASVNDELVGKEFLIDGKFAKSLAKTPTKHGTHMAIWPTFDKKGCATGLVKIVDGNNETFVDNHVGYEGHYPELDGVIDRAGNVSFEARKKELLPILRDLIKQANAKDKYRVHLEVHDNKRAVIGIDWNSIREIKLRDLFVREDHRVKDNQGTNLAIDLNAKALASLLQQCETTEFLKFSFDGKYRPLIFERENGGIGEICPLH